MARKPICPRCSCFVYDTERPIQAGNGRIWHKTCAQQAGWPLDPKWHRNTAR